VVSWPVSVVCLADGKLRTDSCRGIRVDGGGGALMPPPFVLRAYP